MVLKDTLEEWSLLKIVSSDNVATSVTPLIYIYMVVMYMMLLFVKLSVHSDLNSFEGSNSMDFFLL